VALARALAAQPRLILLDEPASGLPENELPELGDLIRDLTTEAGVVVIEHRMDLVMSVCDTIHVLDFGKLIASGPPAEIQVNPAVTAAYLGADDTTDPGTPDAGTPEAGEDRR
jgi:branched-chain amino acid transport system ATP-binding protein